MAVQASPPFNHTQGAPTELLHADKAPDIQRFGFILHFQWGQLGNLNMLTHPSECRVIEHDINVLGILLEARCNDDHISNS